MRDKIANAHFSHVMHEIKPICARSSAPSIYLSGPEIDALPTLLLYCCVRRIADLCECPRSDWAKRLAHTNSRRSDRCRLMNNPTAKSLMVQPAAAFVAHSRTAQNHQSKQIQCVCESAHFFFVSTPIIPWPHTRRDDLTGGGKEQN